MHSSYPKTAPSLVPFQQNESTTFISYGTLENDNSTSQDSGAVIDGAPEHGGSDERAPKCVGEFKIWPLLFVTGLLVGLMGYVVAVIDPVLFDLKEGYCQENLLRNRQKCCPNGSSCSSWKQWSDTFHVSGLRSRFLFDWASWTLLGAIMAITSAVITLSKRSHTNGVGTGSVVLYPVSGSGVAELKLRSKGIRLPKYFDTSTISSKIIGIILTGIGNNVGDLFQLCGSQAELLCNAGAAAGFCVAFGAPISGLIFVLEELPYVLSASLEELPLLNHSSGWLIPTLFCCITAATLLKYMDPYGLKAIVMFHVHSMVAWKTFEIPIYASIGLSGGILGALFVKSARLRLLASRKIPSLSRHPIFETTVLAVLTGLMNHANRFTRLSAAEALTILTTPCQRLETDQRLHDKCPSLDGIPTHIRLLTTAFVIKWFFTVLTFGLKVPAGIYVPTMVLGALFGKIVGHVFQLFVDTFSPRGLPMLVTECAHEMGSQGFSCISPGTYALIGAGSLVCGVTRLPVTLIAVLVEITERFDYLVPFVLAVSLSNWISRLVEPYSIYDVVASVNGYPLLEEKYDAVSSLGTEISLVS